MQRDLETLFKTLSKGAPVKTSQTLDILDEIQFDDDHARMVTERIIRLGTTIMGEVESPPTKVVDQLSTMRAPQLEELLDKLRGLPGAKTIVIDDEAGDAPELDEPNRYEVGHELGRGGMGQILQGTDRTIYRDVAIKTLTPELTDRGDVIIQLIEEAQVTGQLEHPCIVPVHDMGLIDKGRPYFAMKLIKGSTLTAILNGLARGDEELTRLYPRMRLLTIFHQVCLAVAYAHDKGVVHRDLKPDNIMIGDYGEVTIMDWGIAQVIGAKVKTVRPPKEAGARAKGRPSGTPLYISPEQIEGNPWDERADIYSLGVILYSILSYRLPFDTDDIYEALFKTVYEAAPPPSVQAPERSIPPSLDEICMRAMAKRPADRYASAKILAEEVEAFIEGQRERERMHEKADAVCAQGERFMARYFDDRRLVGDLVERIGWAKMEQAPFDGPSAVKIRRLVSERMTLELTTARDFSMALRHFTMALGFCPDHEASKRHLLELYQDKYRREGSSPEAEMLLYGDLALDTLKAIDPDAETRPGSLLVRTSPPGADIHLVPAKKLEVGAGLAETTRLGVSPLQIEHIDTGGYVVIAHLPGHEVTYRPVVIMPEETQTILMPLVRQMDEVTISSLDTAARALTSQHGRTSRLGAPVVTILEGASSYERWMAMERFKGFLQGLHERVYYHYVPRTMPWTPYDTITTLIMHRMGIARYDTAPIKSSKMGAILDEMIKKIDDREVLFERVGIDRDTVVELFQWLVVGNPDAEPPRTGLAFFEALTRSVAWAFLAMATLGDSVHVSVNHASGMDPSSVAVLEAVIDTLDDCPVHFVLDGTPSPAAGEWTLPTRKATRTFKLARLGHRDVYEAVTGLMGWDVDTRALHVAGEHFDGSLIQLKLIINELVEGGWLVHRDHAWVHRGGAALPPLGDTLHFVQAILGRLPGASTRVLEVVSVAGEPVPEHALPSVGVHEPEMATAVLLDTGLLEYTRSPDGTRRYSIPVVEIAEAVAASMEPRDRARVKETYARWLEAFTARTIARQALLERLYADAGCEDDARRLARELARVAKAIGATAEAAHYAGRG